MSYVLRDYQQKASNAAVSFFANRAKKNNAIMVLPTLTSKLSIQESIQRCFIMCLWIRPMRYGR